MPYKVYHCWRVFKCKWNTQRQCKFIEKTDDQDNVNWDNLLNANDIFHLHINAPLEFTLMQYSRGKEQRRARTWASERERGRRENERGEGAARKEREREREKDGWRKRPPLRERTSVRVLLHIWFSPGLNNKCDYIKISFRTVRHILCWRSRHACIYMKNILRRAIYHCDRWSINQYTHETGLCARCYTPADATIILSPSSLCRSSGKKKEFASRETFARRSSLPPTQVY